MPEPFIKILNISKSFGHKIIINDLCLELHKGEVFGLIGKSGCGKSTLMKILLGIHKPDSGKIIIDGKDLSHNLKDIRKLVGYTTQENSFYDKLTINENMRYYANLYSVKPELGLQSHIDNILKSVGLLESKDALAFSISGGMKRRLDFAISLIHDPKILILDEPTTGLDPLLVSQFWDIVRKTKSKEKTIIISSHIFPEIQENSDRIGIMYDNKIAKILKPGKGSLYREFEKTVK